MAQGQESQNRLLLKYLSSSQPICCVHTHVVPHSSPRPAPPRWSRPPPGATLRAPHPALSRACPRPFLPSSPAHSLLDVAKTKPQRTRGGVTNCCCPLCCMPLKSPPQPAPRSPARPQPRTHARPPLQGCFAGADVASHNPRGQPWNRETVRVQKWIPTLRN